jgi:hypothetical protein
VLTRFSAGHCSAAFIGYLILLQAFLLYVRVQAKSTNDRTPITLSNPLSSVLQSQLQPESGGNDMIKNLASSFLSSSSTFVEYDLKQARSMQSGLIINMGFMWFLHFVSRPSDPVNKPFCAELTLFCALPLLTLENGAGAALDYSKLHWTR